MAKLIKAATARKRAQAVNPVDLVMANIALNIEQTVAEGGYHTGQYVGAEVIDEVREKLEAAGYTTAEQFEWLPVAGAAVTTKGFFGRLFDKVFGDDYPTIELSQRPNYSLLNIGWEPDDEEFLNAM